MRKEYNTLFADENTVLTDGTVRSRKVELGKNDDISRWSQDNMTEEEMNLAHLEKVKNATKRISELKEGLSKTDYKAIKFAEGWISEQDFAPVKQLRQALREEINELEELTRYD